MAGNFKRKSENFQIIETPGYSILETFYFGGRDCVLIEYLRLKIKIIWLVAEGVRTAFFVGEFSGETLWLIEYDELRMFTYFVSFWYIR